MDHERCSEISSLGDLGHPCFHLSLCMAEDDASRAEELGLVTAIVEERVKSSAACLAEAGPHLVLYSGALAHGTAEPLLRIACSAILEQDIVEGGPIIEGREEEASALAVWRLTVVMQHFLDSERLVLRLRPRCQAYIPEMRDMARALSQGTANEEAPASEPESKTGGMCASLNRGAGKEQPPPERAVEAGHSPSGKENEGEEGGPADEDSWRRGGTSLPSRTRHKRPRTSVGGSSGGGALSCSSFYSRKPGALLSRLQAWLSQQCSSVVAPPSFLRRGATPSTSPGLSSVYRVFAKQALAFDFHDTAIARHAPHLLLPCPPRASDGPRPLLKALSCPLRLWAFQAASDGHRGFAVCGLPLFLPLYLRSMPTHARHVYEIIREGYPCRLYFDVEFEVRDNPGLDGDRLVGVLLAMAAHRLNKMFGLEVPLESFLQLDSSTPSRFSRHVIAHLPRGRLFASTVHVGRFVQHLMRDIGDSQEGRCLWVKKSSRGEEGGQQQGGPKEVLFVDTSVYTRNRSFRLLGSRKHGPGTPTFRLHNARSFRHQPLCPRGCAPSVPLDEEGLLLASLVVPHVPCGHHYLGETPPQEGQGAGAAGDGCPLLLRVGEDESQPALKLGYQGGRAKAEGSMMMMASSASAWSSAPSSLSSWSFGAEGGRASPFPSLDRFVLSLVTQGGVQGTIRSWSYTCTNAAEGGQQEQEEGGRSLLTYQIGQNRWCANVGRMHRSNHIMMVADLRRGWLVQRCHDPECRHYRSGPIVMPSWARPSLQAVAQAEFDAALAKHIHTNPQEYP